MFGRKKKPTEYKTIAKVHINATPQQVFDVIDPSSPDYLLLQQGFTIETDPDVPDSCIAQHPDAPDEYNAIIVNERKVLELLEVSSERLSEGWLFGCLLSATSTYVLSPSETGGTTLELSDQALFDAKAKGAALEMEHNIYDSALSNHLECITRFCELQPEQNEHHPLYKMNTFWKWFINNEQPLRMAGAEDTELLAQLGEQLQKASPYLSFEMRALDNNKRELTIHADGMNAGFAAVEKTVAVAPHNALPEWQIVAFKQPKGAFYGEAIIDAVAFDPRTVRYQIEPINEHGTRDITLYFETYTRRTRDAHMGRCFFILDHCLGEYRTATEIGEITLSAITKAGDDSKPIELFASEFI